MTEFFKSFSGDDDFYGSLGAGVSDDDMSNADPRELARSLGVSKSSGSL